MMKYHMLVSDNRVPQLAVNDHIRANRIAGLSGIEAEHECINIVDLVRSDGSNSCVLAFIFRLDTITSADAHAEDHLLLVKTIQNQKESLLFDR